MRLHFFNSTVIANSKWAIVCMSYFYNPAYWITV